MKAVSPFCFARAASRCAYCCLTFLAALACTHTKAADLGGYWVLDLQRSELVIDESALSPGAIAQVRNFNPLKQDPVSVCMPYGMPRVMTAVGAFPMEIVQTAKQVTLLFDAHDEVRRIFLNKTKPADATELAPAWLGYAYGQWQGDTLLVETIGMNDQSLVDATGIPHSEKLQVVERIARIDANTLLDEMTLHDTDALTRPITRKLYFTRTTVLQQREFYCAEGQWLDHVMSRAKELTRELAKQKSDTKPAPEGAP